MSYTIHELNEDITLIRDSFEGCIYLVKGTEDSLVIDLGMEREPLKPIIEKYLGTKYKVAVTHGHLDHIGRSGEFDHVYMSFEDLDVYRHNIDLHNYHKMYSIKGLPLIDESKFIEMPEYFDLGDRKIYIIPCHGHTPGSVIFADPKNKTVFTGDAIGSGSSIWLQVDHALNMKQYYYSVKLCYYQMILLGIDDTWIFLGGHFKHEYYSKVSDYNLLDIHIVENMLILVEKLVKGKQPYRPIHAMRFSTGQPMYSCYHKAEIIFTEEQLK